MPFDRSRVCFCAVMMMMMMDRMERCASFSLCATGFSCWRTDTRGMQRTHMYRNIPCRRDDAVGPAIDGADTWSSTRFHCGCDSYSRSYAADEIYLEMIDYVVRYDMRENRWCTICSLILYIQINGKIAPPMECLWLLLHTHTHI